MTGEAGNPESPTSARLLRTAAELFRQKGYAATSTRDISDRLGIQKASLYYHIRTKEDLLYAIAVEALEGMTKAVREVRDAAHPEDQLFAVIVAHVEVELDDRDLHATALTEMRSLTTERHEEVLQLRDAYQALIRETITAQQSAGLIRRDIEPRLLTLALLNLLNWAIFWYDPEGPMSSTEIGHLLAEVFVNGASVRS